MSKLNFHSCKMEGVNQQAVAQKINEKFPFITFGMEDGQIKVVHVGDFQYFIYFRMKENESMDVVIGGCPAQNFGRLGILNDDLLARITIQVLFSVPVFQTHYNLHEMKKLLEPLKEEIAAIRTMISYTPGGPGYDEAKASFESRQN